MALSVLLLNQQRWNAIDDADLDALSERIPPDDRCVWKGRWPTRAALSKCVTDSWYDAQNDVTKPQGYSGIVIRYEDNSPYGFVFFRAQGDVARIVCWLTPIDGRTIEAIQTTLSAAQSRGFSAVEGFVFNERLRSRLARFDGVRIDGFKLRYVF